MKNSSKNYIGIITASTMLFFMVYGSINNVEWMIDISIGYMWFCSVIVLITALILSYYLGTGISYKYKSSFNDVIGFVSAFLFMVAAFCFDYKLELLVFATCWAMNMILLLLLRNKK